MTLINQATMDNPKKLTTKQATIINLLHRFRFLKSTQIQILLNDKTTHLTNDCLKTLTLRNYLGRRYTRILGEGNQPAIYYLAKKSLKALELNPNIEKTKLAYIYREKTRSKQFISRALFIADYYLFLANESEINTLKLHFFTKTDLQPHPYMIQPLPDAYFARIDPDGVTKRDFLEVIDEGMPRFALKKRVRQYNDYLESGEFEKTTNHPFPTILFICPNVGTKAYLKKYLIKTSEEASLDTVSLYLATRTEAFAGAWEKVEVEE
jgi:hypothetical protein